MIPGIELELGGTSYIVPPLSLPALRLLSPRLKAMRNLGEDSAQKTIFDASYLALKRNYPEITRRQIEGLVEVDESGEVVTNEEGLLPDLETMERVFDAVMDISGVKRKEIDEGKATAVETTSTGTISTAT